MSWVYRRGLIKTKGSGNPIASVCLGAYTGACIVLHWI